MTEGLGEHVANDLLGSVSVLGQGFRVDAAVVGVERAVEVGVTSEEGGEAAVDLSDVSRFSESRVADREGSTLEALLGQRFGRDIEKLVVGGGVAGLSVAGADRRARCIQAWTLCAASPSWRM